MKRKFVALSTISDYLTKHLVVFVTSFYLENWGQFLLTAEVRDLWRGWVNQKKENRKMSILELGKCSSMVLFANSILISVQLNEVFSPVVFTEAFKVKVLQVQTFCKEAPALLNSCFLVSCFLPGSQSFLFVMLAAHKHYIWRVTKAVPVACWIKSYCTKEVRKSFISLYFHTFVSWVTPIRVLFKQAVMVYICRRKWNQKNYFNFIFLSLRLLLYDSLKLISSSHGPFPLPFHCKIAVIWEMLRVCKIPIFQPKSCAQYKILA